MFSYLKIFDGLETLGILEMGNFLKILSGLETDACLKM